MFVLSYSDQICTQWVYYKARSTKNYGLHYPFHSLKSQVWSSQVESEVQAPSSKNQGVILYLILWTADFGLHTSDFGLWTTVWTMDIGQCFGLRTSDYALRTMDFGLLTMDFGQQTSDFGLRSMDNRLLITVYGLRHRPCSIVGAQITQYNFKWVSCHHFLTMPKMAQKSQSLH